MVTEAELARQLAEEYECTHQQKDADLLAVVREQKQVEAEGAKFSVQ